MSPDRSNDRVGITLCRGCNALLVEHLGHEFLTRALSETTYTLRSICETRVLCAQFPGLSIDLRSVFGWTSECLPRSRIR